MEYDLPMDDVEKVPADLERLDGESIMHWIIYSYEDSK